MVTMTKVMSGFDRADMIYEMNWVFSLLKDKTPDSKVHGVNMGPAWVLSAPAGPHVGPMNLALRDAVFEQWVVLWLSCNALDECIFRLWC